MFFYFAQKDMEPKSMGAVRRINKQRDGSEDDLKRVFSKDFLSSEKQWFCQVKQN